jgi:hypothetical protein
MHAAAIPYRNGKLEASAFNDVWTVRLANLEVRARYLDLALAELLGNAPEAHRLAARLMAELADVVEQQEADYSYVAPTARRERRGSSRYELSANPLLLGLRVFLLAAVVAVAFMLTTWLSTLR